MKIILRSKSENETVKSIQDIYKSPVILDFVNNDDFDQILNSYNLPKDSGRISDEDTTRLYKARKAIVHTVEGDNIPKFKVTEQLEELIKSLKEDKTQLLKNQLRNKIRATMEDDSLITPATLLDLYEKQKYESKKIEQKKKNLRQIESDLEIRENNDRLREGDLNRREKTLEAKEKRNSTNLQEQLKTDVSINQSILEHAEAVSAWEETKKQQEERLAEERRILKKEKEDFEREKEEKAEIETEGKNQNKILNMISPTKNRKEAERLRKEKETFEKEKVAFEEYRKKLEKDMRELQEGQSDLQKSHQETLNRIRANPELLNNTELVDDVAQTEQSLWDDMNALELGDQGVQEPPKGNLNEKGSEPISGDILAAIARQENKSSGTNPFPPPRIGPTQLRNGPPKDLFQPPRQTREREDYILHTEDEENDGKPTKIEIPRIPTDVSELETYIDVLESLTELFPRPKTFIYSILIKSNQMGLLPMLQPNEKESLSEFASFLRTNFTGKDYFARRKEFDNIKQNPNENVNLYWRRTWRAYYVSKEQKCPKSYDKETNTIIKKDIYFKFVNGLENGELKKALLLSNTDYDEMPEKAIKMESIINRNIVSDITSVVGENCYKCGSPSHKADRCQASPKIRAKHNKRMSRERGRSPSRRYHPRDNYEKNYNRGSRSSSRNYSSSRSHSRGRFSSNDSYRGNRRPYNENRRSNSRSNYRNYSREREPYRRKSGYRGRSERYRNRSYSSPRRSFSREYYRDNTRYQRNDRDGRSNSRDKRDKPRENRRENSRERDGYRRRSRSYDRARTTRSPYPRYVKFDDE